MKLLLLGASGLVGSRTLKRVLSDNTFSEVIAPTRKPLASHGRLINPLSSDLRELVPLLMSYRPDAVICALGTTRKKAGSKEAFRHVDYELPLLIGKAAREVGVETYAIVTAMGASVNSPSFYCRTKGEVERDVRAIGFRSLTICRPSLIGGERNETRFAEETAMMMLRSLAPILPKRFRINPAEAIAAALLDAVAVAETGCRVISPEAMN